MYLHKISCFGRRFFYAPAQRFSFTKNCFYGRIVDGGLAKIHFHSGIEHLSFFKSSGDINIPKNKYTEEQTL